MDKSEDMRIPNANHEKRKIRIYRPCSKPKGRRYMHTYIYMYGVLQTQREEITEYDALENIKLQAQREEIHIYTYIHGLLQTQKEEMRITRGCSKPQGRRNV